MPEGTRPAPPPGTCRTVISGTVITHKWAIVMWLNLTSAAPAVADLQLLANKVSTAWGTNLSPQQSSDTIMNEVLLVWTPTAGSELFAVDTTSHPGTHAGTAINNTASCAVINHRTGEYYRGGHSRTYFPGIVGTLVDNGSDIQGAYAAAIRSGWSAFSDAINTGPAGGINGAVPGTVRFASSGAWLNPPRFVPWQTHSVRSLLGTQRSRLSD